MLRSQQPFHLIVHGIAIHILGAILFDDAEYLLPQKIRRPEIADRHLNEWTGYRRTCCWMFADKTVLGRDSLQLHIARHGDGILLDQLRTDNVITATLLDPLPGSS